MIDAVRFTDDLYAALALMATTTTASEEAVAYNTTVVPSRDVLGGSPWMIVRESGTFAVGVEAAALKTLLLQVRDGATGVERGRNAPPDPLRSTLLALLGAPMNYHWWGLRRKALNAPDTYSIEFELHFTAVVLAKHAKVSDAWFHRKWCLEQKPVMVAESKPGCHNIRREWTLIAQCSELHHRNYAAWQHFVWLAKVAAPDQRDWLFARAQEHYERLVSDPSAVQSVNSVIHWAMLHDDSAATTASLGAWVRKLLTDNMRMLRLHADHGHDGLWSVRRGLIHVAVQLQRLRNFDVLGSWTLLDELSLAAAHCDCFCPGDEARPLKSLADSGGTPRWHAYNSAVYGLWLVRTFAVARAPQ